MRKINKLLNEEIKGKILEELMKNDQTFSGLLKVAGLRDHGQLNYHLKSMIKEGLINNKNKRYTKTLLGERMGVYINQFQSKEIYPLSVVCAIVLNDKGEYLLLKRAKSPQRGKWGFAGGKVVIGEKISQTAKREVYEETGLKLDFDKVVGFFPSIFFKSGELSFHANIIAVLMKQVKYKNKIEIDEKEHLDYRFVKKKDLSKYDLIKNNAEILQKINNKDFMFEEVVYKEK